MTQRARTGRRRPRGRGTTIRQILYQSLFVASVGGVLWIMIRNAVATLGERGVATGFGFLVNDEANFVISETIPIPVPDAGLLAVVAAVLFGIVAVLVLRRRTREASRAALSWMLLVIVPGLVFYVTGHTITTLRYEVPSTYALGLLTGLGNTVKVALGSLVFGTLIGFAVGIARLSSNWIVARWSSAVVEITRNVPLLLQIFFWYFAVLGALPPVRQSITLGSWLVLNNRGVSVARPSVESGLASLFLSFLIALSILVAYRFYRSRSLERSNGTLPAWWPGLIAAGVCLAVGWLAGGAHVRVDFPTLQGFNYQGGMTLTPEFTAMLIGLSLYSAGFIAEIVRSAILSVPRGQTEAALSLGLSSPQVLSLVTLPQARRVMIPPLVGTYLGTIKDSSLGVAIGYPELVSVGGTILDVSGQVLEVLALTIAFYMTATLLTSAALNWYDARQRSPRA